MGLTKINVLVYLYGGLLLAVKFAILTNYSIYLKIILIFLSCVHSRWGFWILNRFRLVETVFGMEFLEGYDRGFCLVGPIREEQNVIVTCIKMDEPDDLEQFRRKVLKHFQQFKRCKSKLI